jgi:hypothetical protein
VDAEGGILADQLADVRALAAAGLGGDVGIDLPGARPGLGLAAGIDGHRREDLPADEAERVGVDRQQRGEAVAGPLSSALK